MLHTNPFVPERSVFISDEPAATELALARHAKELAEKDVKRLRGECADHQYEKVQLEKKIAELQAIADENAITCHVCNADIFDKPKRRRRGLRRREVLTLTCQRCSAKQDFEPGTVLTAPDKYYRETYRARWYA